MIAERQTSLFDSAGAVIGRAAYGRTAIKRPLSHQEFAERYVKHHDGPSKDKFFRASRQPFTRLFFAELDKNIWPTVIVSGPSQSGKTLTAFVIPTLRDVVVLRENPLIGVPEADMATDKWDRDFLPTLTASPDLQWLIPKKGPGSRGGRVKDRITLGNGIELKIMSRGGKDTAKAGYTASRVRVTEAAGWSHAGEKSQEADPLRQLKARLRSLKRRDPRRSLIVEGTLTIPGELPWRARGEDNDDRVISTRSTLQAPCVHCEGFVLPGRLHLVGWQDAESEDQAANEAHYLCPACGQPIDDDQRRTMLQDMRLVHHGQTVDAKGDVVGPVPETSTLWFAWESWHNALLDIGDFAAAEWLGAQAEEGTIERENAEKELCQFVHGVTFKSSITPDEEIKATAIRNRTAESLPRGVLPPDAQQVTIGVDIGDWTLWWFALAGCADGHVHCPGYGALDVKRSETDDLATRIPAAISELRETICEVGFAQQGKDGLLLPSQVWIDIGYRPDDVARAIRSAGGGFWTSRYKAARGRGACRANHRNNGLYAHPTRVSQKRPRIGTQWFAEPNMKRRIAEITFNADHWKLQVVNALRVKAGAKGSLVLYTSYSSNEHARVSNHLASEQLKSVWDPKKGIVQKWVKAGQNHLQDCAAMAMAALDASGWRLADFAELQECEEAVQEREPEEGNVWRRLKSRAGAA